MRLPVLSLLLLATVHVRAQGCAATPEAAATAIIGSTGAAPVLNASNGYRVQDVRIDPLMQRVWVRVSHCGDASAPLILVPVRAMLTGAPLPLQALPVIPLTVLQDVRTSLGAPISVHPGDAVKAVFTSTNVQMELDATANGQGRIGDLVEITLARRGDEPAHRMHGVLRAPGRVEVQP